MINYVNFFKDGFSLENPKAFLPWNTSLDKIAEISNATWTGDRYTWPKSMFLNGLEYPLISDVCIIKNEPFKQITALLIGDDFWDDKTSFENYDKTLIHLIALFGQPNESLTNDIEGPKYAIWIFDKVEVCLSIFEQHIFKCHLSFNYIDKNV
jgi:hypothetical protein